jgi:hypothetical protein
MLAKHDTLNSQVSTNFFQTTLLSGRTSLLRPAMDVSLSTIFEDFQLAVDILQLICVHDAFVPFKTCMGGDPNSEMFYAPRHAAYDHPILPQFVGLLRSAAIKTCNLRLIYDPWIQASLPEWSGVHYVQSVFPLAPLNFLASAAGMLTDSPSWLQFCELPWQPMKTLVLH